MKVLLDNNKKFFKANLHAHSTLSDGKVDVDVLKEEYKKRGYSIVAFTDHEYIVDNSYLNDNDFITITSCEVAIKQFPEQSTLKNFDMKVCHLNFYALDPHNNITPCYSTIYGKKYINEKTKDLLKHNGEYERVYSAEGINEMIKTAKENGFIVSYNHPSWSLENAKDYLEYDGMFAVEIYNHSCVKHGIPDDETVFDDMLRAGKRIFCTACDDCHNSHDFDTPHNDSFGGWVCINADKLEYSEVMDSLINGNFYASSGPQISSLVFDNGKVIIKTSPCCKISLITHGRRTVSAIAHEGKTLSSAEFEIRKSDIYFRIRVEDENGKKAYSQAYLIEELIDE